MVSTSRLAIKADAKAALVGAKRSKQPIPERNQIAEIALVKTPFGAVVKAMQAWSDDERGKHPLHPVRKLNIAMLEDRSGDEYRVCGDNDRYRSAERNNDQYRWRHCQQNLERMIAQAARHIEGGIRVMNSVKTPSQRDGMHQPVHPIISQRLEDQSEQKN